MTAPSGPLAFDGTGPLPPPGVTVIEASAGTGKTFALTSLVVRAVVDGIPLSELLAVTFTRMATGELRDRVRDRMVAVAGQMAAHAASSLRPSDPLAAALVTGPPAEVEQRLTRLADAVADFDAATIATTHGFCQLVLHGLGTAGDVAAETVLLEDPSDLVAEVVDDLYLRGTLPTSRRPTGRELPFGREVARRAAVEATRNPDVRITPEPGDEPAALLGRLALRARDEVAARLRAGRYLTYDDLLFRLAASLADPDRGPRACERLRRTYSLVLVDEFQDTDPVQWSVLRHAFGSGRTRLVLIGDPKQAIYSFRGADVHAYLEAGAAAATTYTLTENWRSDQPLLDALEAFFQPVRFGHPGIPFRPVVAAPGRDGAGLVGAPAAQPLRVRVVDDRQAGIPITPAKNLLRKGDLADWVATDVARDVARLLGSGATIPDEKGGVQPVSAGHVAVLTRTNRQAVRVRDALRSCGLAAVVAGLESVFASEAAAGWLRLLEGLQEPAVRSRAAAVALTPFVGMTAAEVASAGDREWESVHDRLNRWAAVLSERGVAALYRAVTAEESLPARVLAGEGGERLLTDLGHVAHLLHSESVTGQVGAPSLRAWLAARIRTVGDDQSDADERSRRLDSDADAVQVLTVHRVKGLEFPVVYCPYMWDAVTPGTDRSNSGPVIFHDPDDAGRRTLDVGCVGDDPASRQRYAPHAGLARAERRGEDLRLLYVALTRARHQVVLWWGRAQGCGHSPLGRILLCRDPGTGAVGEARSGEPHGRQVRDALGRLAARAPGLMVVEDASEGTPIPGPSPSGADAAPALAAAVFARSLDRRWRRASFTSITAAAHDSAGGRSSVGSEPEDRGTADEPALAGSPPEPASTGTLPAPLVTSSDGTRAPAGPGAEAADPPEGGGGFPAAGEHPAVPGRPVPLAALPGGTVVGTFVHRVLEVCDFAAADLGAELRRAAGEAVRREGPVVDAGVLVDGLRAALTTPLGPLLPGIRLCDIHRRDRLDELGFELPVAGGDHPAGTLDTAAVADLLAGYIPDGGPLSGYPLRLADPLLGTALRGYLTGSLDLVFRRPGPDGTPRWYLADYKTNWLGTGSGSLTDGHYRSEALDAEMQRRHYPLQALIYTVALHRYLRWRQPGYDPHRHLGGVLYLFLRGMTGPGVDGGEGGGVFSWAVPPPLVVALSDLIDSGSRP